MMMQKDSSVSAAVFRLYDAIAENQTDKARSAKDYLSHTSGRLDAYRERRRDDKFTVPQLKLTGVQHDEVAIIGALAMSARTLCEISPNKKAAGNALKVLNHIGIVKNLAECLAEGTVRPDSLEGRAIITVLSEAASAPETRLHVANAFRMNATDMTSVCLDVLKDSTQPSTTRTQAAQMVTDVARDPEMHEVILSEVEIFDTTKLKISLRCLISSNNYLSSFVYISSNLYSIIHLLHNSWAQDVH